jgi:hypothetical protein
MQSWLALVLLLANFGFFQPQAPGNNPVTINGMGIESYHFGDKISFQAQLTHPELVKEVYLFLEPSGEQPRTEKITPTADGQIKYDYDLTQKPIRSFVTITYWLQAITTGGDTVSSIKQNLNYEDNRFIWQSLDTGNLQIRWINGDRAFGQAILNAAQRALHSDELLLPATLPNPTRIYVYPTATDLQGAMLDQLSWVAGHAIVDLGTITISVTPGPEQNYDLDRQIPHELMHVLTYQVAGEGYQRLPVWFTEGLASLAETNPNPDYQSALTQAVDTRTLIPMAGLCNAFPQDASGAFLAYAQSASFVRYINQKNGTTGFQKLISNYQNGLGCEEGVNAALGSSLEQFDHRWQQEVLGVDTASLAVQNLAPYLISGLLLIALPLGFGLLMNKKSKKTQAQISQDEAQ